MGYMILLGFGLAILLFILIWISIRVWRMLKSGKAGALGIGINLLVISLLIILIFAVGAATVHNYLFETGTNLVQAGKYNKAIKMLGGALSVRNLFSSTPQL